MNKIHTASNSHTKIIKGYLFAITSAALFGCMPMMANIVYSEGVTSLSLVLLRNILSVPVLALLSYPGRKTLRIPAKALPSISLAAIMGCSLTPLLLFSSYQFMASGTATVLHFIYPAMVVVGGILFLKEPVSKGNIISVLICITGISLFYTPGEPLDWRGSLLALFSGLTYAAYVLLLSRFRFPQVRGFLFSFYIASISSVIMLIVCLATGQLSLPVSFTGWAASFFFALVINVGAVVLFQQATFLIGGQRTSILSTVEPLTSIILGAAVLQETIGIRTAFGSALVILASILIALSDMRSKKS